MKLHEFPDEFKSLISIVAKDKHLPEPAIERDYYIVLLLQNLANSEFADMCVFKGGTSLSKCYPGSIERFSEDIDLTFLGMDKNDKTCERSIKQIESIMTVGASTEKIADERSKRSKSMLVWFGEKSKAVKLEIGSSIRPDPYSKKTLKSYIQDFLEERGEYSDVLKYDLRQVTLNVLDVERTFVDKLMSVKRHAFCDTIASRVRHIYDVARLFNLPAIKDFLCNTVELKRLMNVTKETDSYYMQKRNISIEYNPVGAYDFESWKCRLDSNTRKAYESLHKELLYTDEQQSFDEALNVFSKINKILESVGE